MMKGLLALDENLASSIALRYASWMVGVMPLQLQAGHVEPLDKKGRSSGTGWVRQTWEEALKETGRQAIQRLLLTEKVPCPFVGMPKVFIGERDDEFLEELQSGDYDLFMEGNLNSSDVNDFYKLTSSSLYSKTPCSIMVVKNLVADNNMALLCGDGVDHKNIVPLALSLLGGEDIVFDLLYYRYQELDSPVLMDRKEAGSTLFEVEEMLREKDLQIGASQVVCGTPESVASTFSKYSVVASSFPVRKSPRLELLAQCPSPVLLCK